MSIPDPGTTTSLPAGGSVFVIADGPVRNNSLLRGSEEERSGRRRTIRIVCFVLLFAPLFSALSLRSVIQLYDADAFYSLKMNTRLVSLSSLSSFSRFSLFVFLCRFRSVHVFLIVQFLLPRSLLSAQAGAPFWSGLLGVLPCPCL